MAAWTRTCTLLALCPTCALAGLPPVAQYQFLIHIDLHSAIILLHDPYAHVQSPGCVSGFRILEASRRILDLIYIVRSTSFDITLLDPFCAVRYLPLKRLPSRPLI
jgi:hypothetical protein